MNINDIKVGDRIGFIPRFECEVPVYWYNITKISSDPEMIRFFTLAGFKDAIIDEYYLVECLENRTAFIANTDQEKLFHELRAGK